MAIENRDLLELLTGQQAFVTGCEAREHGDNSGCLCKLKGTIVVIAKLHERVCGLLESRGSNFDTWVRYRMKSLVVSTKFYGLADPITFGKYHGDKLNTVIRTDPEYVAWCLREVEGFGLDPEALEVLATTGVDL